MNTASCSLSSYLSVGFGKEGDLALGLASQEAHAPVLLPVEWEASEGGSRLLLDADLLLVAAGPEPTSPLSCRYFWGAGGMRDECMYHYFETYGR